MDSDRSPEVLLKPEAPAQSLDRVNVLQSPTPSAATSPLAQPITSPIISQPTQGHEPSAPIMSAPHEYLKTLSILHRHERTVSVLVILATLLLIAGNIAWSVRIYVIRNKAYNALTWVQAAKAQQAFGPSIQDRSNGTLDMSGHINGSLTTTGQKLKAGLNQQVNFTDGLSFMITGFQKDWHSQEPYTLQPSHGNYYVKLDMVIGNRDNQSQAFYFVNVVAIFNNQTLDNIIYYPSGAEEFVGSENDLAGSSLNPLNPGEVRKGAIVIQVPINTLPDVVLPESGDTYTRNSQGGTSIQPVTMQAEVTLR